ncbi:CaiB/BaiF CoA transferase family protein [Agrobacterium larrymoorei]|uniref:CoA transferase n=1 Tax=Agrobacterium larrymoorei TaxID=160699 RepID=A0A4D7E108_9HYPH|nr:CaiB/BaiF CoA-transferase family protein [Agrobacterium larrymoorei]QCJ01168.1 CoA transferase [Agrobacterium larrymoorei]QYA10178.1 CoA transferase [Agrobacterium larrymoorei]
MGGVLSGRTVLELGSMIAAPFATHILQQLGATVIKIEPPGGETTRKLVRGGPSGTYIAYNRGKRSICLDLQSNDGGRVFRDLVAGADIVLHNLSPGAARKMKVTFQDCEAIKPGIVYCHIKGYGAGPQSEDIASNPIAEAATGVMFTNRSTGKPSRLGPSYHDQFAGCYAVIGVLSALLDATASPERRNIELGLYETGLHIAARELLGIQLKSQITGKPEQEPSPEFSMPGYGAYETADDRWVYLVMLTDEHWRRFCLATELEADPELATLRQRRKNRQVVEDVVAGAVRARNYAGLAAKLNAAGVGHTEVLPGDKVLDADQAKNPPKYSTLPFASFKFDAPDFPVSAAVSDQGREAPPPLLGEHTVTILRQSGYSDEVIAELLELGAVNEAGDASDLWSTKTEKLALAR